MFRTSKVTRRTESSSFHIDTFDDMPLVHIFSNYDKEVIILQNRAALAELYDLIGHVLGYHVMAAANGKGADHA